MFLTLIDIHEMHVTWILKDAEIIYRAVLYVYTDAKVNWVIDLNMN